MRTVISSPLPLPLPISLPRDGDLHHHHQSRKVAELSFSPRPAPLHSRESVWSVDPTPNYIGAKYSAYMYMYIYTSRCWNRGYRILHCGCIHPLHSSAPILRIQYLNQAILTCSGFLKESPRSIFFLFFFLLFGKSSYILFHGNYLNK